MSFPQTIEELKRAGYTFEGAGRCRTCGEDIEWWQTPSHKKIPMNQGTAVSHFSTCPQADQHRSAPAPTSKISTATLNMEALQKEAQLHVNKNGPMPEVKSVSIHPEIGGSNCWTWIGALDKDGYGFIRVQPHPLRVTRANRVAFFLGYGRWPTPCCLHKCDNVECVRYSHLFEGTIAQNNRDRADKGRSFSLKDGEVHCTAKLTIEQVKQIRVITGMSQSAIAREFGISQAQVCRIRAGQLWAHVRQA